VLRIGALKRDSILPQEGIIGLRSSAQMKTGPIHRCEMILVAATLFAAANMTCAQRKGAPKSAERQSNPASGKETFRKYCASCHGDTGKGDGPTAIALKPPPSDLTTLSERHEGKYPTSYVAALLKFGRSLAAHGSLDMPVWGSRFKELDPIGDPTGQQHVDDLVAYVRSLQAK
jgi:mono/diheme cytochrome c family protein